MLDNLPEPTCQVPPEPVPVQFQGYIDERSQYHVTGWLRNLADLTERVPYQVRLPDTGEVLASGVASALMPAMRGWEGDDGLHGFYARFSRPVSPAEQATLAVQPPAGPPLGVSSRLVEDFAPCIYIIMDVVDNCNLRCPFCIYDYSKTFKTNMMTQETFDAVVRLAGKVTVGNFWFSCLHEPTLHPRFMDYIEQVPGQYRDRIFFTSNLAKRMPETFFNRLAASGVHHVNVSIESRDPAVYERMRKGARHRIFQENWDRLVKAFKDASAPPMLRYISLAYKSNLRELPDLVEHLLNERAGVQIEIRATYDFWHIGQTFRQSEYLDQAEWQWLRDRLAGFSKEQLALELPRDLDNPDFDAALAASLADGRAGAEPEAVGVPASFINSPPPGYLPGRYGLRVFWDGQVAVQRVWGDPTAPPGPEIVMAETNIREITDLDAFFCGLPS